jgi:hypothetical protein
VKARRTDTRLSAARTPPRAPNVTRRSGLLCSRQSQD